MLKLCNQSLLLTINTIDRLLKNFQQPKLGILAFLLGFQLFADAAPFDDNQVTQVRAALSPYIENLKGTHRTNYHAVAILAEANSWLNGSVPDYITNLYTYHKSYGSNIQEFVARLTAGMMLGNGFKLGVVKVELGKDISNDEMKLYQKSVIGIAQYITADKIEENSVKTNGDRSHIPAHTNALNQLFDTNNKNAYAVKINFNKPNLQMFDTNNQNMNQPIVNKPIFKNVELLKDIFDRNLNETIERIFFVKDPKNPADRKYYANAFLPNGVMPNEIHDNGHLWPEKYLKIYFKHSFLSSLIDIESEGKIRLINDYKNAINYNDFLKNFTSNINNFPVLIKVMNFTGSIKKSNLDSILPKFVNYCKLQDAFVKGLQHNERLLKIGTNYMEHKVREEKKKNAKESDRADLLQDCVYTIVLKAIEIMNGILENIKDNKADFKINEYTKEIEQFFANYAPSIEGVDESDLEVLKIEKLGDKNIGFVPDGIRKYVDNGGV